MIAALVAIAWAHSTSSNVSKPQPLSEPVLFPRIVIVVFGRPNCVQNVSRFVYKEHHSIPVDEPVYGISVQFWYELAQVSHDPQQTRVNSV